MSESDTKLLNDLKALLENYTTRRMDGVTQFWETYSMVADAYDKEYVEKNLHCIEGIMLFAGLFSAVSAAYLVAMEADLKPDPTDTTNALLMMLVHSVNNTAFSNQDLGIPVWNGPSSAIVCSQILGYTALSASLLAALGAVLAKQWLHDFICQKSETPQDRCRRRQQKLDSLKTWHFSVFMAALSALIQLALFLFSTALSVRLWEMNHQAGLTLVITTSVGASIYLFITLSSLLSSSSPFHTPVSSTIRAAIRLSIKLVEETTEYWAWCTDEHRQTPRAPAISWLSWILVFTTGVIAILFLGITSAVLLVIVTIFILLTMFIAWVSQRSLHLDARIEIYRPAYLFWKLPRGFYGLICSIHNSAQTARKFVHRVYLDPVPDPTTSDARSVAWLLETSTRPENFMAAAELVPDVEQLPLPDDLSKSLVVEKVSVAFLHSVKSFSGTRSCHDRLLQLSKALILVFCRVSQDVSSSFCKAAVQQVTEVWKKTKPEDDPNLIFMLAIVAEVLSYKLDQVDRTNKLPLADVHMVSPCQTLLVWLLPLLENLLQLDGPRNSRFLPCAYRVFLLFEWPEGSELGEIQGVRYFRALEICFNGAVGVDVKRMDKPNGSRATGRVDARGMQEPHKVQANCLNRILDKLKRVDIQSNDIYGALSEPLAVLSKLASISQFRRDFDNNSINSWALEAFTCAVHKAASTENWDSRKQIQYFTKSLIKLAAAVDAFRLIKPPVTSSPRGGNGDGQMLDKPLHMDSKCLLSYLVEIGRWDFTSEATKYAMKIMLENKSELPELAFNPSYVRYMLSTMQPSRATGQWGMRNVPDVTLQVLFAACHCLLDALNKDTLLTLHSNLPDVALFLTCGVLNEGRPTLLKKVLQKDDQDFNAALLGILEPVLGDPFVQYLSWQAKDTRAHTMPQRAIRGVEFLLVLSKNEDRKKRFDKQVGGCIAREEDSRQLGLPLAIMVGWLLREVGPLSTFEDITQALFPSCFEETLSHVWDDLDFDKLEDVQQELPLLMDCTTKWLSYVDSGTDTSSGSPLPATPASLTNAHDRLWERRRELGSEGKRALFELSKALER